MTAFVCGTNETHNTTALKTAAIVGDRRRACSRRRRRCRRRRRRWCRRSRSASCPTARRRARRRWRRCRTRRAWSTCSTRPRRWRAARWPTPTDAALFEAYYKANLSLHAAAARPTMIGGPAHRQGGGEPARQEPGVAAPSDGGRPGALRHHRRHAGQAVVDRQHAHHDGQGVQAQPDVARHAAGVPRRSARRVRRHGDADRRRSRRSARCSTPS